jgi:hypothetical protein
MIELSRWIVVREGKQELFDFGEIGSEGIPPVAIAVIEDRAGVEDLLDASGILTDHADDHVREFAEEKGLFDDGAHADVTGVVFGVANVDLLRQGHESEPDYKRKRVLTR